MVIGIFDDFIKNLPKGEKTTIILDNAPTHTSNKTCLMLNCLLLFAIDDRSPINFAKNDMVLLLNTIQVFMLKYGYIK
jgi:hypothetical protein